MDWSSVRLYRNCYRFGSYGAFMGNEVATWISRYIFFLNASRILSVYYDARYDHGHIPSYSFVFGWIWQYSYTADVWSQRHGFSLCEHG